MTDNRHDHPDFHESPGETDAIMNDPDLMASLRRSREEAKAGLATALEG
jgi:hypothetical protein